MVVDGPEIECRAVAREVAGIGDGVRPFTATRQIDLARAVMDDPLEWPDHALPRVPEALRAVIAKAMSKKPDQRHASADDFRAALAKVREELD